MKKLFAFLFFLLHFSFFILKAQNHAVDSLQKVLNNTKQDTTRLRLYLALVDACDVKDNLKYGEPAVELADKLLSQTTSDKERRNFLKQKADAEYYIAVYYISNKTKNDAKLREYIDKILKTYKVLGDSVKPYVKIGNLYYMEGNYPEALKNYKVALRIAEEIGDTLATGSFYLIISGINGVQGDFSEELKNCQKALSLYQEKGNIMGIYNAHTLIGMAFEDQGNYPEALKNYFIALNEEELAIKGKVKIDKLSLQGIARSYNTIGRIYEKQGNYTEALKNQLAGLQIDEKMNDSIQMAFLYDDIAITYMDIGNYAEGLKYALTSLHIEANNNWFKFKIPHTYITIGNANQELKTL